MSCRDTIFRVERDGSRRRTHSADQPSNPRRRQVALGFHQLRHDGRAIAAWHSGCVDRRYCAAQLASGITPDTELPKGGSGKILKRVLRERFWAQREGAVN
jgi:hypothetical protein